jgi:hypothetical protein
MHIQPQYISLHIQSSTWGPKGGAWAETCSPPCGNWWKNVCCVTENVYTCIAVTCPIRIQKVVGLNRSWRNGYCYWNLSWLSSVHSDLYHDNIFKNTVTISFQILPNLQFMVINAMQPMELKQDLWCYEVFSGIKPCQHGVIIQILATVSVSIYQEINAVSETLDTNSMLTQLITWEDFMAYGHLSNNIYP